MSNLTNIKNNQYPNDFNYHLTIPALIQNDSRNWWYTFLLCEFRVLQKLPYEGKHLIKAIWPVIIAAIIIAPIAYLQSIFHFIPEQIVNKIDTKNIIDLKSIGALIAFVSINYWRHDSLFGKKWTFAANKFYEDFKDRLGEDKNSTSEIYDAHIAVELLIMDIWYEESFNRYFKRVLFDAADYLKDVSSYQTTSMEIKTNLCKEKPKYLDRSEVLKVLREYIDQLSSISLKKNNRSRKNRAAQ